MKTARTLLQEFVAFSFQDPVVAAEMFAEDGIFEIPYLASFGIQPRYKGRQQIAEFFQFVRGLYPGFVFENFTVRVETPDSVSAEYEFRATSAATERSIHQLFFGYLEARDGKIVRLREAFNGLEIVRGLIREVAGDPKLVHAVNGGAPDYPQEPLLSI